MGARQNYTLFEGQNNPGSPCVKDGWWAPCMDHSLIPDACVSLINEHCHQTRITWEVIYFSYFLGGKKKLVDN